MKEMLKKNWNLRLFLATTACCVVLKSPAQPLDEDRYIMVGGIKQFVHAESNDAKLPLLLFLHGGPGGSVMSGYKKWCDQLVNHFVVVQWDQRETGRTLDLNASPEKLTVDLFKRDASQLVDSLLKIYGKTGLYLVGHSWGTVLGFHLAQVKSDKVFAYIAAGPMINQLESERIALKLLQKKAEEANDQTVINELQTVRIPFENGEQLYFHRKNLLQFAGSKRLLEKDYVVQWSDRWLKVYNEAAAANLMESMSSLSCPIVFFLGRHDYQTNSEIAESFFEALKAPSKKLIWFENSAHAIPTTEPVKFQAELIKLIK